MQKKLTLLLTTAFLSLTFACSDSSPSVSSSGDKDIDQTARYALHTVEKLKRRNGMDSPSEIINYMFSTIGSAELTPPSKELEPEIADSYNGPRPANNVGLFDDIEANQFFKKVIILSADDERKIIRADAYRDIDLEGKTIVEKPFKSWEWK